MLKLALSIVAVSLLALSLIPGPARAQPARVFVAAQGSDANSCSFALPCRTFQHAHDVVAAGGEIDVLDPAGYGILTITKSISIQGHGFAGIAAGSGTTAITANAPLLSTINLRGLLIDGVGTGSIGISMIANTAIMNIQDSMIRNFTTRAIDVQGGQLFVTNTVISDSSLAVQLTAGAGILAKFSRVSMINSSGISAIDTGGSTNEIDVTVADSDIGNFGGGSGVACFSNSATMRIMVRNSTISGYAAGNGIFAHGGLCTIYVTRSTITQNGTGLNPTSGASLNSFGDNSVAGNATDGTPTGTIALK